MTDEQKKKLEQKLWDIANTLRGKMDADEFRDYILGFIFYKYLSERMHAYATRILDNDKIDFTDIDETSAEGAAVLDAVKDASVEALGYFLKPSELFSAVAKRGEDGTFILGDLATILSNIERSTMGTASEEDFDHLFEDLDLTSTKLGRTEDAKNALISRVLTHLDAIDFRLDDAKADVLGDAYEYLIGQFASGAGKKAGEFYTPQQVSTILARIVTTGKTRLKSVYDPTCGSGSLLLRVAREVSDVGDFFGQEMNRTTYNLARMNMILHGVHYRNFDLKQEDTLEHPQHDGMQFEAIVANPPFSAKWSARPLFLQDDRFAKYGKLAPASKADYAFVTHMLAHLDENGAMAVVLPHGALFRGGAEGVIREYIIREKNWLDAVIGLPANIFYGTGIPTCIMVFKKCRETDDVLFIDASTCFERGKKENRLRDEDVERIVCTYRTREQQPKFSYRAQISEIAENDYNLNIPRYVSTFEVEPEIDLNKVFIWADNARSLNEAADRAICRLAKELGIEVPQTSNLFTLEKIQKGLMQKLLSQQIRFKSADGSPFQDWENVSLNQVLTEHQLKSNGVEPVYSVSVHKGLIDQVEHLGRSYSAANTDHYNLVLPGDIVYTKSPTGEFPMGIIKQSTVGRPVIVSPLYGVFTPETNGLGVILNEYFRSPENTLNYLSPIVQKGAKNTIAVTNGNFLKGKLTLPRSPAEQQKIADAISAIDAKISAVRNEVSETDAYKSSILNQMFV